jgi:hypothetical protein
MKLNSRRYRAPWNPCEQFIAARYARLATIPRKLRIAKVLLGNLEGPGTVTDRFDLPTKFRTDRVSSQLSRTRVRGLFGQIRTRELRDSARICNLSIVSECG